MREVWKQYPYTELDLQVSSQGRFRYNGEPLKPTKRGDGYVMVSAGSDCDGTYFHATAVRVVAQTFLPNPLKYAVAKPIDGDNSNAEVSNLIWVPGTSSKPEHYLDVRVEPEIRVSLWQRVKNWFEEGAEAHARAERVVMEAADGPTDTQKLADEVQMLQATVERLVADVRALKLAGTGCYMTVAAYTLRHMGRRLHHGESHPIEMRAKAICKENDIRFRRERNGINFPEGVIADAIAQVNAE
jgi:hypothetical protein